LDQSDCVNQACRMSSFPPGAELVDEWIGMQDRNFTIITLKHRNNYRHMFVYKIQVCTCKKCTSDIYILPVNNDQLYNTTHFDII